MGQSSNNFVLHSFRRCPYAMRVRIVLAFKQIEYTVIEERLGDWTDFMIKNIVDPKVPILVHNGRIIRESNIINEYLENVYPEVELVPFNRFQAKIMRQWWLWCDEEFILYIDQYKYEDDSQKWFKGKTEIERQLEYLELSLKRKHFLLGDKITLADIAIIPFVYQIQRIRRDAVNFRLFPKVKVWADQILGKPFFKQEIMKKHSFAKSIPSIIMRSEN